jgi:prepilin-type N-terminal cleavage/methylation domain-containing protein
MNRGASGFTLIELALSLAAGAVVLVAIFGVFSRAIHLRDDATQRTRAVGVQAHAVDVLRDDLRQARISGGTLAAGLGAGERSAPADGVEGGAMKLALHDLR